jgi:hypothetical protein
MRYPLPYALTACGCAIVLSGCASIAVTDDAIERNTSVALGVPEGAFSITNRLDSGVKTTYDVTTKSGQHFSCYVTGGVGVTGRTVSDAICHPMSVATAATPPQASASAAACNALLKAAGRC